MYAIYKQTHPPTGVEHCVHCHFVSSVESNLIVAGTSQLRIYKFYAQDEQSTPGSSSSSSVKTTENPANRKKLELLSQYSLFGNIECLQAVRLAGNTRDSLLMSFKDAKLAIVDYDPGTHDLKTRSLHFFEDDKIKGRNQEYFRPPMVRVDPERRCSVMLIYGTHLVVLPFRQEGILEEQDVAFSGSGDRSPLLPSYTINLKDIHDKLCNIIDVQFLHGYYEPTLLLLYEPLQTWPGRLAMRHDTCALIAVSLNLSQRTHPVVWSLNNLPFDCSQVLAVPKPIGGVLICATNSLLYLNQSVPPYGVSLNSIADNSTDFPLRPQEGVVITLDGAQAAFISSDKLVFSLKGGEIYVVTLVADGVRSVRNFNFDKAAASVLTSCVCECGDGYLFLGSRLGNSLLVKYTEKAQDTAQGQELDLFSPGMDPPQAKRRRLDTDYTYALDDLDELEVYGKEEQPGVKLTSYTFEVCDSLLNIGPCTCIDMGEPAFLSEEFVGGLELDLELVSCSGFGKNGALSVLQRSVRPQVVTTFELPGCVDMWTVLSGDMADSCYHSFLLLSREDSSMVLKTEQEIMELDHSGFTSQYPTVFAGNLGNGRYILQVTPQGVRLLEGVTQLYHIPLDAGLSSIVWCSLCDPYAVMMTTDGSLLLLEFTMEDSEPKVKISRPQLSQGGKVCACCAYQDVSGMFTTEKTKQANTEVHAQPTTPTTPKLMTADDEDELLYGESSVPFASPGDTQEQKKLHTNEAENEEKVVKLTWWCVVCHDNGVMEIYTLPDFSLVFLVKNFNMAPRVLVDSGSALAASTMTGGIGQDDILPVKEVLLTGVGHKNKKPLLVAFVEQDLLIYEAFTFAESSLEGHLNLRFKKLQHNLLLRDKKSKQQKVKQVDVIQGSKPRVASLRVFSDISSYSGVFVCGSYPYWLFVTSRGALRAHPMKIDGAVTCFAPFHNVNCPKGFLYFNKKGELRISVLPTHLSYDAPWPVRKVPLRCTPHFVAYNRESKTCAVVTSLSEQTKRIVKLNTEDHEPEDIDRDERFVYPIIDRFSLQLISPVSWEIIPSTRIEMEDWEHVTTCKNLLLSSQETHTGHKGFICVGTTHVYGEDITCRGRILIFDIIEVVPEPGQPLTKNKFKMLYGKEQKGPVSALTEVNGYLVSAIGQKIYIWSFKDNNDLVGMAFIDSQMYIHSLVSIKNLIIAADLFKSITLLRLQEETKTLAFVSKDPKTLEVYGADFVIDGPQLGFLVSDVDQNLFLLTYQPEAMESFGGQRLLQRADINVGSNITSFFRIRARTTGKLGGKDLRHLTCFGTLDGGIGLLLPMTEKTYRRLHMLQTKLVECIPHVAGLNPKAFRLVSGNRRSLSNAHRNILDAELLCKFIHLGTMERFEVTKKIGTTPAQILDDLMDVERACAHF
ncbi:cleavage and polyadenylation specificity factor subunit 1-like [Acropora muricata]|uniref:cleavage and polyadenylation specificity factor subunit 1-like n=1 Tax=Acropora muricata TaxID=159855 RepID=UPI001CF370A2|nr:cleavage and polyadenylation specificity factor subunit 1-like isoform X2 [Acropora millepora]